MIEPRRDWMELSRRERAWERLIGVGLTMATALGVALGMHVFVYPTEFAPSGVDGLATVLQAVTGINAGFFMVAINLPLLIGAWFVLKRRYVYYTILYTVFLSFFLILLAKIDFYAYRPHGERILPAIFGGFAHGLTGVMLRLGASSGGVDVIAGMIRCRCPHRDVEKIITVISLFTVAISYPVYRNFESVLLSVVEIVVCERVTALILRTTRTAIRCEIVVCHAEALMEALRLRFWTEGIDFVHTGSNRLTFVIQRRQLSELFRVIKDFPDARLYYSDVMGVVGKK